MAFIIDIRSKDLKKISKKIKLEDETISKKIKNSKVIGKVKPNNIPRNKFQID
ncbi:MAG: hypothetical protein ACTSQ4_02145 [Candidatus Heimdallarchaeaceae archaeon]